MVTDQLQAYRALMRKVFGYDEFRPGQGQVLSHLASSDVMGVMPTGSGKSLCYVLPALTGARTLVVSPLIALMRDQVDSLASAGVGAAFINSSLDRSRQNESYLSFVRGEVKLLYVAPERFANGKFVSGLMRAGIDLLAIDEAHCVSEWGHDFRPDYLTLGTVRKALGSPRTLALTATAEPRVQGDILQGLGIPTAERVVTSVDRPNLRLSVEHIPDIPSRRERLVRLVSERARRPGIVYARTRKLVEELSAALNEAGLSAQPYHAGMSTDRRDAVQRRFTTDEITVIVATNAFGMGVDKPDVRFVIHFNMPGRLESYYQEAGRAGRDGEFAECILLCGGRDAAAQRRFVEMAHPEPEQVRLTWHALLAAASDPECSDMPNRDMDGFAATIAALRASGLVDQGSLRPLSNDPGAPIDMSGIDEHGRYSLDRLDQMIEYAETAGCRRGMILRYFGEKPACSCSACDRCEGDAAVAPPAYPAALYEVLMDLRDEVARRTMRAPYQILELRTVRDLATYRPATREELLATWGIGEVKANWFGQRIIRVIADWEKSNPDAPERQHRAMIAPSFSLSNGPMGEISEPVQARLRQWRLERSRTEGVPAFVIFSDRTLTEIASKLPRDRDSLLRINGIGPAKLRSIGSEVLEIIDDELEPG